MRDAIDYQNHSVVIAQDLWNLNDSGMHAYLELAAETGHYKTMKVFTTDGEIFLGLNGPELHALDLFLVKIGFIFLKEFSLPVYYEEQKIGFLQGERYIRYVYQLFYIFLVLLFTVLTLTFLFYLIYNRRLLEKQVQERTQRYHDLVNLLPEMVLETDQKGKITFANENAQERLGIPDYLTLQHDLGSYIRFVNGERGDFFLNTAGRDLERKEYRAKGVDGTRFPVLVRSAPVYSEGRFVGARVVIIDITERNILEDQLSRDQKMKSIGMMASGVAHDLNNILAGIINYPELLLLKMAEDNPYRSTIKSIKKSGERAAAVVADLLTIARNSASVHQNCSINELILDYCRSPDFQKLREYHPKVKFEYNQEPLLWTCHCSKSHIEKTIVNLVINGFESIAGEGAITVTTQNFIIDENDRDLSDLKPGLYIAIHIVDTGGGIPESDVKQIFEPFFSKKDLGRSGTGLGLTVAWTCVKEHQGTIDVSSSSKGTHFKVYLPATNQEITPQKKQLELSNLCGNKEKILVVDDEESLREIAVDMLSTLNYQVSALGSGEEAVDFLKDETTDLILLDMQMEPGMSGRRTFEQILKFRPDQRALIATGYSTSADVQVVLELGAGAFIKKPYTIFELGTAVQRILKS